MPLLFIILGFFLFSIFPAHAVDTGIVISAFSSSSSPEWVEIKNNSATESITLTGWKIVDSTDSGITLDGCISPNTRRTFTHASGWLNNDTDIIKIKDASGSTVGIVVTYGGSNSIAAPAAGKAMYMNSDGTWAESTDIGGQNTSQCVLAPTATLTPTITLTPTVTNTPVPTMPQPKISIMTFPSVAHIQQAFSLRFEIANLTPNTDYHIKGIGGVNGLESMETFNSTGWYDYGSSWDNMPKFKTDGNGKISNSISMRVKSDQPVGEYKVQIRLRANDNNFDSDLKYVTIQAKLPSVTPTPNDPSPSVTPTFEPSPTPEFEIPTLVPTESELSSDVVITPTPASAVHTSSSKVNLPLLFMLAGGILIIAPFGITYLSRAKKNS